MTIRQPSRRYLRIWRRRFLTLAAFTRLPTRFTPPRCPNRECKRFAEPTADFFVRKGSYWPLCRDRPVPRFQCKECGIGFSRQTFREDYCDNKPWHNQQTIRLLSAGLGLRESARQLVMARKSFEAKARKIGRHCGHLQRNFLDGVTKSCDFTMDEMITFEGERTALPLSLSVLIEHWTWFIVATCAAPLPASGKMTEARRKRIQELEAINGPRVDKHAKGVYRVFRAMVRCMRNAPEGSATTELITDMRPSYEGMLERALKVLPEADVAHLKFKGDAWKRDISNPLFRINHTLALMRDRKGRLRRRSWLVSKRRRYLNLALPIFICVRNYVRPWRNRSKTSPAQLLGVTGRRFRWGALVGWRQDWGSAMSPHPQSNGSQTIQAYWDEMRDAA